MEATKQRNQGEQVFVNIKCVLRKSKSTGSKAQ